MSMNVGNASGEGEVMVEMNTTPLIDVMLVLLTLLIITLPIQTHAVKLDMPHAEARPPPTVTPETVELGVDFDGIDHLERHRPSTARRWTPISRMRHERTRSRKSMSIPTGSPNMTRSPRCLPTPSVSA